MDKFFSVIIGGVLIFMLLIFIKININRTNKENVYNNSNHYSKSNVELSSKKYTLKPNQWINDILKPGHSIALYVPYGLRFSHRTGLTVIKKGDDGNGYIIYLIKNEFNSEVDLMIKGETK